MGRTPEHATAFGARAAPFLLSIDATWAQPAETDRHIAWARAAWEEMQHFSNGGV